MSNKDFLCNDCIHSPVCSLKNQYEKAQNTVDSTIVPSLGGEGVIKLSDIPWIKQPIVLKCIHFRKEQITI